MRHRLQILTVLLLLLTAAHAGDSIDRIVATVNRDPILSSDVDNEAHFEALQEGKSPDALDTDRREVLNRIVERELIRQQIADEYEPAKDLVDRRILEIRSQYAAVKNDTQWVELLERYSLDADDLRAMVVVQLKVLHFLDVRLRPTVHVDSDEVGDYYNTQLVPKLKAAGKTVEPLTSVKQKIEEVLLQQKMNEVFNAWIANLRNQSKIQIMDSTLAAPAKTVAKGF